MTSPDTQNNKRICIGKISSTHGVKGLVKILPYCEDTSLLSGEVLCDETSDKTLNITLKNSMGKFILAEIEGITTPEDAKKLKNLLYVPRNVLPEIDNDDEFYIEDLIGLDAHENDKKIGIIKAFDNFGAGDLLEIKPLSGETFYIPFQDEYVTNVDLDNKIIHVKDTERFIIE